VYRKFHQNIHVAAVSTLYIYGEKYENGWGNGSAYFLGYLCFIYLCEIYVIPYYIPYYKEGSLYGNCRMLNNYHGHQVICIWKMLKCSYVEKIGEETNPSNVSVIFTSYTEMQTLLQTTNRVLCHTSGLQRISSETFMLQLYQRYTYMAKNMQMGEVTAQHIF